MSNPKAGESLEPCINPNAETREAMEAARRGELEDWTFEPTPFPSQDYPIGAIIPPEWTVRARQQVKQHVSGFLKYGHRYARKKRQCKKNRKKYGIGWKLAQLGQKIGTYPGGFGNPVMWEFVGAPHPHYGLLVDPSDGNKTVSVGMIMRVN